MLGIIRTYHRTELPLALTLVALCLAIGLVNEAFFSVDNLTEILRSGIVFGLLALGAMLALVSGGIDVSFTAIAVFSLYSTTKILLWTGYEGNILLAFLIAGSIGLLLGTFNAVFVALFRLPTLIVTLGTLSLFRGVLLTFIGSEYITVLPASMISFSRWSLLEGTTESGALYRLPAAFGLLLLAVAVTVLLLRYTMLGRGIYALGGSAEAAMRAGFSTRATQFFIYGYVGLLSGTAGLVHASLNRMANPFDLVGTELNVIAAVVLGGARLTGGHGSVAGTMLGVAVIVVINSSLILVGLSSYWHKIAVGLLILIGTGLSSGGRRESERGSGS